jgi:hypothetical protein
MCTNSTAAVEPVLRVFRRHHSGTVQLPLDLIGGTDSDYAAADAGISDSSGSSVAAGTVHSSSVSVMPLVRAPDCSRAFHTVLLPFMSSNRVPGLPHFMINYL